jgi:hypothetical protein
VKAFSARLDRQLVVKIAVFADGVSIVVDKQSHCPEGAWYSWKWKSIYIEGRPGALRLQERPSKIR